MGGPPLLIKGAFVRLEVMGVLVKPDVVAFQYNPEQITRKLKPYERPVAKDDAQNKASDTAAPYDPEEELELALDFDASDDLAEPETHPVAVATGVAGEIAELEELLYPESNDEDGLLAGKVSALANKVAKKLGIGGGTRETVPETRKTPVILFVWGPGRVVPVKITSFTVEEQAFNLALYPYRAKVSIGLKVLTDDYFAAAASADDDKLTAAEKVAQAAYRYTKKQKSLLTNPVVSHIDTVLSMLPF